MTRIVLSEIASTPAGFADSENCSTCGNPMADHSVRHPGHKAVAAPRGGKALCPHGSYEHTHNTKDKYQLVQFWCIWNQVFDGEADKTPITYASWEKAMDWMNASVRNWGPDKPFKAMSSPTKTYSTRVLGEAKPGATRRTTEEIAADFAARTGDHRFETPMASLATEMAEAEARMRAKAEAAEKPVETKAARKARAKRELAAMGTMR